MSEENVALVQSAYAAFNLGDFDAAMELLDPEIEWQLPPNIPDTGSTPRPGPRDAFCDTNQTSRRAKFL